ncbi:uncharacterized protein LOC122721142 [Apis laboriosa]|uniref:uncharacterized protein LOC102677400 n=1 Tax=Apis dorsata TaxID=7462 RepID=UPI0003DF54DD|nr:uncharacterized protein LOC102677400 [Apis dorsata]XP_043804387.1 uncharacterized protein LOC122721142 [Apis laboriosa]
MFRPVDRPLSFRQRASNWIYKMLFLWSREPAPGPRAGPWFAWFATALVLWRCRRSVAKAILAVSPLRLLKKRNLLPLTASKASSTATLTKQHQRHRTENSILQRKQRIRTKVKRLCTGDGPHVTSSTFSIQSQQIHYRMTRSGKIYGKYPNKVTTVTTGQGNH